MAAPRMFAKFFVGIAIAFVWINSALAVEQEFAPMALNSFTKLPAPFPSAKVFGQDRALLGNIQGVDRAADGVPVEVHIGVAGGRQIALRSAEASYDAVTNVVVTDMDATKAALSLPVHP